MKARDVGRSGAKGDEIPSISRALGRGGSRVSPCVLREQVPKQFVPVHLYLFRFLLLDLLFCSSSPFHPLLPSTYSPNNSFIHSCLLYLLSASALCPLAFAASLSSHRCLLFFPSLLLPRASLSRSFLPEDQNHDDAREKKRKLRTTREIMRSTCHERKGKKKE